MAARVLGPKDGELLGSPDATTDRFMIDGADSGGRFALVEHTLAPRALAAPLHLHTQEDEFSYVLEGTVGALLGDEEVFGKPGDLIFKPRGQWHTFWNAGDTPTRILELISPSGLEELFRLLGERDEFPDQDELAALVDGYGCLADLERTMPIVERHGLAF